MTAMPMMDIHGHDLPMSSSVVYPSQLLAKYLEKAPRCEELILEFLNLMQKQCSDEDYKKCLQRLGNASGTERPFFVIHSLLIIFDHLYKIEDYSLCCQIATIAEELVIDLSRQDTHSDKLTSLTVSDMSLSYTRTEILVRLSSSYLQTGKYKEGIRLAEDCLKYSKNYSDKVMMLSCLVLLANAFSKEKEFEKAISYNHLLLQTGRSLDTTEVARSQWNNQLECQVLWNLSACYNSVGSIPLAVKYAEEYLRVIRFGSQNNLAHIYSYLGSLQYLLEDFESSYHSHQSELAISKKFNDKRGIANAYGNLGLVYAAKGKTNFANELLSQELKMAKLLQQADLERNSLQKCGIAKMNIGDNSSAIKCFKKVYQLARDSHDWKMQCTSYIKIGKLHQRQGTLNFARHYLEQGMNRANDLQMKNEAIDAEMHLAQVLKVLGYHEDARKHFKEVILYFENILDTIHHFDILIENDVVIKLTSCCKDLQEVLVKLDCYQDALEIAELCHSRIYMNMVTKRKSATLEKEIIDAPRTFSEIAVMLQKLPSNTTVLYFTVSSEGFLLWMLRPDKGLRKFVKQNNLPSHPIHQLIRDCMACLGVSKKGGACCYKTSYRQKLTKNWKAKRHVHKTCNAVFNEEDAVTVVDNSNKNQGIESRTYSGLKCKHAAMHSNRQENDSTKFKAKRYTNGDCFVDAFKVNGSDVFAETNLDHISNEPTEKADNIFISKHKELILNKSSIEVGEGIYDSGYQECDLSSGKDDDGACSGVRTNINGYTSDSLFISSSCGKSSRESTFIDRNSHDVLLKELFVVLIGKIEHLLPSTENGKDESLIIVPDGIINMVPFHLLIDKNGMSLYQRFRVSTLPCLALLSSEKKQITCNSGLVYGNPYLKDACLRSMNGDVLSWETENAEKELLHVSSILGCSHFSGKIATKENFIQHLSDNDIIHIASHGDNTKGCLLFTPNSHRMESAAEQCSYIFDLDDLSMLKLNSKLVILSCCDQCPHGVADCKQFEINLATGFLSSGALAVVMFLYTIPDDVLRIIIHNLYRLLEKGNSVSQSLQLIYNLMGTSEGYSHPGYWGGIVHIGQDARVDIGMIRRNELKRAIDEGTSLQRRSREIQRNMSKGTFDSLLESSLSIDAKDIQMRLAFLLRNKNSLKFLVALKDLLKASIKEIESFKTSSSSKVNANTLPAIAINPDLFKSQDLKEFVYKLGFHAHPAPFENGVTFLMPPPWNFDKVLHDVLVSVTCLHEIILVSNHAAFYLSRILPNLAQSSLVTLENMINRARKNPESAVSLNDPFIQPFWASAEKKLFLQHIGLHQISRSLYLDVGSPFDRLQSSTACLLSSLLSLHQKQKNSTINDHSIIKKSYCEKMNSFRPWFAIKTTNEENNAKHLLARTLHSKSQQYRMLEKRGRHWQDATLESWKSAEANIIKIGPEKEDSEQAERYSDDILRVKVKPGGTPSSCRFPIVEKPKLTKYRCYKLREELEDVFIERNRKLENRKCCEVCKSYTC